MGVRSFVCAVVFTLFVGCGNTNEEPESPPPGGTTPPPAECVPKSCADLGRVCGAADDACGGTVECGTCEEGETCTAEGRCFDEGGACVRQTCEGLGRECGFASNGCGGTLDCGNCGDGEQCNASGQCTDEEPSCTPKTCTELGRSCGALDDGCGGIVECGECGDGERCGAKGQCEEVPPTCTPKTCLELGRSCGTVDDGCGATLTCGSCGEGATCSAEGQCVQPTCGFDQELWSITTFERLGVPTRTPTVAERAAGYDFTDEVYVYRWTVPQSGEWVLSTVGSTPDTRLDVRIGACGGPVLAPVSTDFPDRYRLQAGQVAYLTVVALDRSGFYGDAALRFQLSPALDGEAGRCSDHRDNDGDRLQDCWDAGCRDDPRCRSGLACTDMELGSSTPQIVNGAGTGGAHFLTPSCYAHPRGERMYRFTAPRDAVYVFHPNRSGAVLSAHQNCTTLDFACSVGWDYDGWSPVPSLSVFLSAGQTVLIAVQGTEADDTIFMPIPARLRVIERIDREEDPHCEDGYDNDGDGKIDQYDDSCPNWVDP